MLLDIIGLEMQLQQSENYVSKHKKITFLSLLAVCSCRGI